jgi:peptidoglycan/LPS O-acetylase OafA/YrhL
MDTHLSDTSTWLRERIDGHVALVLGVTWLVLFQIAAALEPTTDLPEPAFGIVLELTMWFLLAAMVTGLLMQRRLGLVASLGAAGFLTALSIACPATGHHPYGAWWFGQMACAVGLVAASLIALRRSPGRTDQERQVVTSGSDAPRG